jgi:hypothetical protein
MPSNRSAVAALRKLEADQAALAQRKQQLEEQAALELGRVILGTGLEAFSKKGLSRVAAELGKLGEEGALRKLVSSAPSSSRSGQTPSE